MLPYSRPASWLIAATVGVAALLADVRARARDDDACPLEDGCTETCELLQASLEQPSAAFLSKLKSIAGAGQHVEPSLGPSLLERRSWLGVLNVGGLTPEMAKLWEIDRRYAGPCAGLAVVFWSKLIDDGDRKSAVEAYELRYRSEADAARVARLLMDARRSWDWNYRPFAVAQSGRSVMIVEARLHALPAFRRVAKHFGAQRADGLADPPAAGPCDPDVEARPTIDLPAGGANAALSVFALDFSAAGRFAWLEQRRAGAAASTEWSVHVTDLVDDRALATETFTIRRKGLVGLCVRFGRELARVLTENGIKSGGVPAMLEQPRPSKDPVAVELRPARAEAAAGHTLHDLVLRGHDGSKRIASLQEADAAPGQAAVGLPKVLGIVRSPFERRVAVVVAREAVGTAGSHTTTVQFFGGRLDKGWK